MFQYKWWNKLGLEKPDLSYISNSLDTGSEELDEAYFLSFEDLDFEDIFMVVESLETYATMSEEYQWRENANLTDVMVGLMDETDVSEFDNVHAYSLDGKSYNIFSTISDEGIYLIGDGSIEEHFQGIYNRSRNKFL